MKASSEIQIVRGAGIPPEVETRGCKAGTHPGKNTHFTRYPWGELSVGDAFDIKIPVASVLEAKDDRVPEYNRISANISYRHKRYPERFVARMMDDFRVRVWRVA
jgi:hypothetical protein